jgi:hypothetical protein
VSRSLWLRTLLFLTDVFPSVITGLCINQKFSFKLT